MISCCTIHWVSLMNQTWEGGAFTAHLVSPHLAKQWMWNVWLHSIVRTGVPSTDSSCERTKKNPNFSLRKINMYTWYSRYTKINVATLHALSLWILTTNEKKNMLLSTNIKMLVVKSFKFELNCSYFKSYHSV